MESFEIKNLSFTYPGREKETLSGINLTIKKGEFVTVCGMSGSGKTTFLRMLKKSLAPYGEMKGEILFEGNNINELSPSEEAGKIGFVMQHPDNQIVTDKVWHELAFGLESLGVKTPEIRTKVSEMASFFGIQTWFHKDVSTLSGGQKQLLNLASVMVCEPSVLILDEPTSQLDPIAAQDFLKILHKINREIGTTIILSEHRLEDAIPLSDKVILLDEGEIICCAPPREAGEKLRDLRHPMSAALPAPMRIYGAVESHLQCPLTVREGREWLWEYVKSNGADESLIPEKNYEGGNTVINIRDLWFRYEKNSPDIVKGLNMEIKKGEFYALVGGNATGKTTTLNLINGINKPYRGKVLVNGKKPVPGEGIGALPQNPQSLFTGKTVFYDLMEVFEGSKLSREEKEEKVYNVSKICRIENILSYHPFDISGGEQQRAGLAKVLLLNPEILLLDEPTKGMDADFKEVFAEILGELKGSGVTILMVTHDIEFCAEYADRCGLMFDGNVTSEGVPREFFKGKSFYTTSTNRMARTVLPNVVTVKDAIAALGGKMPERPKYENNFKKDERPGFQAENKEETKSFEKKVFGAMFSVLFLMATAAFFVKTITVHESITGLIAFIGIIGSLLCFVPQKIIGAEYEVYEKKKAKLPKRTVFTALLALFLIPITIYLGSLYPGEKKYYIISLLIIFETAIPFFMVFEGRKPKAREIVLISVLCAIGVAGRMAFFMLPQFKPIIAIIIISGVCLGGETGFLVGAVTGFVSNFVFGQGPWTPWQMFAFGIIGFVSGILFRKGLIKKTKLSLCIYGALATIVLFGGIMNPASVLMVYSKPDIKLILAAYLAGLPLDIIHAAATATFMWIISGALIEKIERIKLKFGLTLDK